MLVRVIEADDALAPAMLKQRMNIVDIKPFQMLAEGVHILFFKIELSRVVRQNDVVRSDKRRPCIQGLQHKSAVQGNIGAEVGDNIHPQHIMIELPAFLHV